MQTHGTRRGRAFWAGLIWIYVLAYTFLLVLGYVRTGFHVAHNDFWGNYYQAEHLDFSNPKTLYDGFFPIGYPVLLRYGPFDDPVGAAFALNAGAALVLAGLVGIFALTLLPGPWALATVVTLTLVPQLFAYTLAPVSDLPMTMLAFFAAAILFVGTTAKTSSRALRVAAWAVAGLVFGIAGLLRQHALVLAAGFGLGAVVLRKSLWPLLVTGLVCALAYTPQIVINLQSGHGAFETYQYINVYKMVHDVRLYDVPADLPPGIGAIIRDAPGLFAFRWLTHFAEMLPLLVPAALCAFFARTAAFRKLGILVLIAGLPYAAAVALGWSERAVLPLLPWTVITLACAFREVYNRLAARGHHGRDDARLLVNTGAIAGLLVLVAFAARDTRLVRAFEIQHREYVAIEQVLREDGVVHPKQVFTTDPTLYLPNTPPYHTYFNGGWLRFSLYQYAERYPNLDTASVTELAADARREGVTHLVLTPAGKNLSFALDELYRDPNEFSATFLYLGAIDGYHLYRRREHAPAVLPSTL